MQLKLKYQLGFSSFLLLIFTFFYNNGREEEETGGREHIKKEYIFQKRSSESKPTTMRFTRKENSQENLSSIFLTKYY